MGNVTIKDVAKYVGVSVATVSRVINNNYYVSPELKEKVLKGIEDLHYYPNSVARSLKNDATYTIGFVVSDISNNYFTTMAKAIEDVINEKGYNLIVCSTEDKKERELTYLKLLMSKKIDGLILNTSGKNNDFICGLSKMELPIVLVERDVNSNEFKGDFVANDDMEAGYILTSHLLSAGHKKIAVINGILSVSTGNKRFKGFKKAMKEYGIEISEGYKYRYDGDFTERSGYKGMSVLLNTDDKPTAVVAMNNKMAVGALRYMHDNNIKVPEDISIVSYGDIENSDLLYVSLTVVSQNPRIIGTKAGELLLNRINNNTKRNQEIIYMPQFIIRKSVMPI